MEFEKYADIWNEGREGKSVEHNCGGRILKLAPENSSPQVMQSDAVQVLLEDDLQMEFRLLDGLTLK